MAVSLKHKFQSAKTDDGDTSLVRPSNWNDEHDLTIGTGKLLGRTTAGSGSAEEISAGTGLTLSSGTLSVTTNTYQPYDADLAAIAGLTSAADQVPYFTGVGTAALASFTSAGRNFLAQTSVANQLAALGITNAKTNLVVFTGSASYLYTPSANTKSIIVWLTGGGGAGGAASSTSTSTSNYGVWLASSGSGAGTLIFSMDATPSQTFQIGVGAGASTTAVTASFGGNGAKSTFDIIIGTSNVSIATAPGGFGGTSASTTAAQPTTMSQQAASTISAPSATYVAANAYLGVQGGAGSVALGCYTATSGSGFISSGIGGGTFWGNGPLADYRLNGAANTSLPGTAGVNYGTGGAGAAVLKRTTTLTNHQATGGAGAPGVCMILEVKG